MNLKWKMLNENISYVIAVLPVIIMCEYMWMNA